MEDQLKKIQVSIYIVEIINNFIISANITESDIVYSINDNIICNGKCNSIEKGTKGRIVMIKNPAIGTEIFLILLENNITVAMKPKYFEIQNQELLKEV